MCSDTFSTALTHLRPHTSLPTPQIYTQIAHLLTQYSTGVSLAIALDSLSELSKKPSEEAFIEATVVSTHENPTIHVLKSGNSYLALYPPSYHPALPPSTVLLLPFPKRSPDALSLAQALIREHRISCAILSTQNIAVCLPFQHNLPHPLKSYTLSSIWQNRDLTPPAVYATLIQVHVDDPSLILADQSPNSPSVILKLSRGRSQLPHILPVPCMLLVTSPTVAPTENSFALHDTPSSTIFYQPLPSVNENSKRKRTTSVSDTLYSGGDLEELQRCGAHDCPITVHTRVHKIDIGVKTSIVTYENVGITVPDGHYETGDELLLKRVTYAKQWIAEDVTNISTLQGVLHCPFVRRFVSIKEAMRLCRGEYATAHIKVVIECAVKQGDFVRLSVTDSVQYEPGSVYMKARGFQQLFAMSKECFVELGTDVVTEKVRRIQGVVWLTTVTCGVADLPVLTTCLRGG